jgi:glutamine synthetase
MTPPQTAEEVLREISAKGDKRIKVAVTDLDGVMRGKYIHIDKLRSALEGGFGFCDVVFGWDTADVCYDNAKFTGWHTGYPDAHVELDPATFRRVPWEDNIPFLLGDFRAPGGGPLAVCPRSQLRRILAKAESMGFSAHFGLEFEWFNFRETPQSAQDKQFTNLQPITPGMFGYSMLRPSLNADYFRDLMEQLGDFRVPVEGLHTETGPGVYEAAIMNSEALEAADRAVLFKTGAKQIAYNHGFMATFMAKWNSALPGCGGHMHQSLWNRAGNAFYDANDPMKMSDTFRHYLAGQMQLLPEFTAFYAPNINSYKRLVDGMWAPTRVTWGVDNRTVSLRAIPGSPSSTRLEIRVPGADINPYVAMAAALAAGLYGIEHKLELPSGPISGNAYEADAPILPRTLNEAADALDKSAAARELFGDAFVDHYVSSRRWEWRQYGQAVTNWELQRYFEII